MEGRTAVDENGHTWSVKSEERKGKGESGPRGPQDYHYADPKMMKP